MDSVAGSTFSQVQVHQNASLLLGNELRCLSTGQCVFLPRFHLHSSLTLEASLSCLLFLSNLPTDCVRYKHLHLDAGIPELLATESHLRNLEAATTIKHTLPGRLAIPFPSPCLSRTGLGYATYCLPCGYFSALARGSGCYLTLKTCLALPSRNAD